MKKLFTMFLVLIVVLALAGCGINSANVVATKIDSNVTRVPIRTHGQMAKFQTCHHLCCAK